MRTEAQRSLSRGASLARSAVLARQRRARSNLYAWPWQRGGEQLRDFRVAAARMQHLDELAKTMNDGRSRDSFSRSDWQSILWIGTGMAVVALVARGIMLYDESKETDRLARRAREFAEAQEGLKPLSKEQWDKIQNTHPVTPFDSGVDVNRARIRTGKWPRWEDLRNWAVDSIEEALEKNDPRTS